MKRTLAIASVLAIFSGLSLAQQQPAPTPENPHASKVSAKKRKPTARTPAPAPQAPAQVSPPVPATLMNSAPVKPTVTMDNGLLTINAPNSTLSDVLSGIHRATGATIEGASPTERVAVKLGPGNPEQVIAALLHGTPYGYVILGSLEKPDAVTRVMLTQQTTTAEANPPAQPPPPPMNSAQGQPDEGMPDRFEDGGMQQNPDENPDQNQQGQPQQPPQGQQQYPGLQPQPAQQDQSQQPQQQQDQTQPQDQQQQQQDPNQPKTPEQLFKELQQLEQQKNQQR